jgi:hypothetical protein
MGRDYKLRLEGIADRFGNVLAAPFEAGFRVKDPDLQGPRLVKIEPAAGSEGVALEPEIYVHFDETPLGSPQGRFPDLAG